jgi:energy-coupling factor transport system permease protein
MYLYQNADSFFHSLHPVTKFCLLLLLIAIPFFAWNPYVSGIVLAAYILLLILSGGLGNLLKFWKMLLLFLIFVFLIWIIVPKLRGLPWSFHEAAMLAIRIDTFVVAGIFFGTITRIEEFTYALTTLGVPYKGAFALSLGFRLVPLFYQNLRTIIDAQRSRGVDLDSAGLLEKGKMYLPMISILISYGLRNADLMAMSLESKGFGYSPHRTSFLQPKFGSRDVVALLAVLSVLAFLVLR